MKTELNIGRLIEKAEDMVNDGMIEAAAFGEKPVQIMESESGSKYILKITMKLLDEKEEQFYNQLPVSLD